MEHLLLLANLLGADPWLSIPHTASDDYVRQFAELSLATLRSDVTVYVEHSNEASSLRGRNCCESEPCWQRQRSCVDVCTPRLKHTCNCFNITFTIAF